MHPMTEMLISKLNKVEFKIMTRNYSCNAQSDLDNFDKIVNVYEHLDDTLSKWSYANLITWRILHKFADEEIISTICPLHDEKLYTENYDKAKNLNIDNIHFSTIDRFAIFIMNEYQYKDLIAQPGDVVFNCGAYTGASSVYFSRLVEDCGTVYSFEPMKKNYLRLTENMKKYPNVKCINSGLSDYNGEASFEFFESGSRMFSDSVKGNGGGYRKETCKISTIDDFVNDNKLNKIDLIKMDIEGAELSALKGAKETIRKFKPKLAICVYHQPEDIFNIFDYIYDLKVDYNYYFHHVTNVNWESVLFCMPAEDSINDKIRIHKLSDSEKELINIFKNMK